MPFSAASFFGLFLGRERADGLGRMLERRVGRVDGDLCQNSRAVDAQTAAVKLLADHVLQIVADVALTHGYAHGKGHDVALGLLLVVSGKRVLDHADLRAVAVRDDDLVAVFDQVCDGAGRRLDSLHLSSRFFAQSVAAQSNHNSFSHFIIPLDTAMAGAALLPYAYLCSQKRIRTSCACCQRSRGPSEP